MRIYLAILISCLGLSLQAQTNALIQFYQVNYLGLPDTNYFLLYKLQPPVLANGSIKTAGFAQRCYPDTNGFFQTNLQVGFYLWTNGFIGTPGIVLEVPQSTNVWLATQIAISGYNTYVMRGVSGLSSSNSSVTITPIANSPGFFDLASIGGTSTNGGTVTSVGLSAPGIFTVSGSPITISGTLGLALATETANTIFAGPTSGGALAPTFRTLVAADIPSLSYVTSVGLSAPAEFTVSGSPVTSSGTLTLSKANQTANLFYAGPASGSPAAPTFRTITLASADFANQGTTTTVLHGNASGSPSFGSVALGDMANLAANSVIGNNTGSPATPVALTPSQVLDIIGSTRGSILERGASGWQIITPGASGTFLGGNGVGADPSYQTPAGGGSAIIAAGTNVTITSSMSTIDFWSTGSVGFYMTNRSGHVDIYSYVLASLQTLFPQALTNNDNRTGGAVFNEPVTLTNAASGAQINETGTNVQFMTWNTNSAGAMKTNTLTMGSLGTDNINVQAKNTNTVQTLLVTQDGAVTLGTNTQATLSTAGLFSTSGGFSGSGASLTNLTYQYTTNQVGSTTLTFGLAYGTNLAADVTIGGLTINNPGFYESGVYWVTNNSGSDHKVTWPSGVLGPRGSGTPSVLYCTNNGITRFVFEHFGASQLIVGKNDYGN